MHAARDFAFTRHQTDQGRTMAPRGGKRRLLVLLPTHAALEPQLALEREELGIAALLGAACNPLTHAARGLERFDRLSHAKHQRLRAAAELSEQDVLARLCTLERMGEH